MLKFELKISECFNLTRERSISVRDEDDLKHGIPVTPGVYLLHHGELDEAWDKGNVFLIGGTYKEGLRKRSIKHRSVLLGERNNKGRYKFEGTKREREYGDKIGHNVNDVMFSYFECAQDVKSYLPFVFESFLLDKYESRHGVRPALNIGRR